MSSATQLAQQKTYNDACMDISLKVSEFFVLTDNYFKSVNSVPKKNINDILVDITYIQKEFNKVLEKHVLFLSEGKISITAIDLMKIKYFQTSFEQLKKDTMVSTIEYKKKHRTAHPDYNYNYFLKDVRKFSSQLDQVISNWTDNYTPLIEKNLLSTELDKKIGQKKNSPSKI